MLLETLALFESSTAASVVEDTDAVPAEVRRLYAGLMAAAS